MAPAVAVRPRRSRASAPVPTAWTPPAAPPGAVRRVVDLFCGAGGTTTGVMRALSQRQELVDLVVVNHSEQAIATYRANYRCRAFREDVTQVVPHRAVPERAVDLLVASPSCRMWSPAGNGRPLDAQDRALCWAVVPWLHYLDVRALLMENVPRFVTGGPLDEHGREDLSRRGEPFRAFVAALEAAGMAVSWHIADAAEYGDPQHRERLMLLARRGRVAPALPEPTHGPRGTQPFRTAEEILDWDDIGLPISHPRKRGRLSADYTLPLIEEGLRAHGGAPFLLPRKEGKNWFTRRIDRPLMTIRASAPGVALIQRRRGRVYHRLLTVREYARAFSLPESYVLCAPTTRDKERLLGNAVPARLAEAHAAMLL